MLVAITGIVTALLFGYSLLSGWVLVASVLYVLVVVTGISVSCAARATWRSAASRTSHYSRSSS
jgi:uncharacterized membrane protein